MRDNTVAKKQEILVGLKEIADFYRCSIPKLKELIQHQGFPVVRVGGEYRSSVSAIYKWHEQKIEQNKLNDME